MTVRRHESCIVLYKISHVWRVTRTQRAYWNRSNSSKVKTLWEHPVYRHIWLLRSKVYFFTVLAKAWKNSIIQEGLKCLCHSPRSMGIVNNGHYLTLWTAADLNLTVLQHGMKFMLYMPIQQSIQAGFVCSEFYSLTVTNLLQP